MRAVVLRAAARSSSGVALGWGVPAGQWGAQLRRPKRVVPMLPTWPGWVTWYAFPWVAAATCCSMGKLQAWPSMITMIWIGWRRL